MTSRLVSMFAFAALGLLAAVAQTARAAEAYVAVANGQKIVGDVLAGTDIRIEFPLAAQTEPRISLTLTGGTTTVSFTSTELIGPDGAVIQVDTSFFKQTFKKGSSTISFKGWSATQPGLHQLRIRTNSRVTLRAKGTFSISRAKKITFLGDDTSGPPVNPIQVSLQFRDEAIVSVKRTSGTAPRIALVKQPNGATSVPSQRKSKTGATGARVPAFEFGTHEITVGYQTTPTAPAIGSWKGVIKIHAFKNPTTAAFRLRNSPGVPVSVLLPDRGYAVAPGTNHVGVASDGTFVLVTSELGGQLQGQILDSELAILPQRPNPVVLTSSSDFGAGDFASGHRLMHMSGAYFAAVATQSGANPLLLRLRSDLTAEARPQVQTLPGDLTGDLFLTGNFQQVAVGVFHPPNGHTVYVRDAATLAGVSTISIGGANYPQSAGAGAVWRAIDSVYELWTPESLDWRVQSDLHRVLYTAQWVPTTADAELVNDPISVETLSTAVSVDPVTKATILHYVVADVPPAAAEGTGKIHRRIFDASGVEVPGSHSILPRASCNRPASCILNQHLFLGYETPTGQIVERFFLLR